MSNSTSITIEMMNASEINEVKIGGKLVTKRVLDGQQKKDNAGNLIFDEHTHKPICWNDSFYLEFAFQGGIANFKVSHELYRTVEENKRYQFVGRAFMKTPYGDGKPYLTIEAVRFDFLF